MNKVIQKYAKNKRFKREKRLHRARAAKSSNHWKNPVKKVPVIGTF
jgi:hypothetical protein